MANENVIINDVTFNWARLASPVKNQFGGENYELQIVVPADRAEEVSMKLAGKAGKPQDDGTVAFNLKRKATKSDGSAMDPVRLVDASRAPIENKASIGNGSKGNVIVWVYDYEFAGSKGRTTSLTAVQVTDHVVFEGSTAAVDFDVVEASGETSPF